MRRQKNPEATSPAMRALWLAVAALLLAGCATPPAGTTTTQPPPPPDAGPEPRSEGATLYLETAAWSHTCAAVSGWTSFNTPGAVALHRQPGDRTLTVTLSWTASNPTLEALRAVVLDEVGDLVVLDGPSPLVLDVPLEEAEGALAVQVRGPQCAPLVAAASQQVAIAAAWNAPS